MRKDFMSDGMWYCKMMNFFVPKTLGGAGMFWISTPNKQVKR
jgi:hypothetical protein